MKKKLSLLLIAIFTFTASDVFATVDYLVVNHMTKQLYWAETNHSHGWIGWETIPEGDWQIDKQKYLELGYKITNNPFLIEEVIALLLNVNMAAIWATNKRRKNNAQQHST